MKYVFAFSALTHKYGGLGLSFIVFINKMVPQVDISWIFGYFLMRFLEWFFLLFGNAD